MITCLYTHVYIYTLVHIYIVKPGELMHISLLSRSYKHKIVKFQKKKKRLDFWANIDLEMVCWLGQESDLTVITLLLEEYMSGIPLLLVGVGSWGTTEISTFRSPQGRMKW